MVAAAVVIAVVVAWTVVALSARDSRPPNATVSAAGTDSSAGGSPSGEAAIGALCGKSSRGAHRYRHVLVVVFENRSASEIIGSAEAPRINALAQECGLATRYHAVARPSLPNYLALTSGSTWGVRDNDPPSAHPLRGANIFSELEAAGKSWREYEEDAPRPCPSEPHGSYAVKHDPAPYYTDLAASCGRYDLPLGDLESGQLAQDLSASRLPSFALVVPNRCNDMHDCPIGTGDAWLGAFLSLVGHSPAYKRGDVVVFVTWDEGNKSGSNQVPMLVAAPSVRSGTRVGKRFTHYSALATWTDLLRIGCLRKACNASSMGAAFAL